jgi:hypothetical protein
VRLQFLMTGATAGWLLFGAGLFEEGGDSGFGWRAAWSAQPVDHNAKAALT